MSVTAWRDKATNDRPSSCSGPRFDVIGSLKHNHVAHPKRLLGWLQLTIELHLDYLLIASEESRKSKLLSCWDLSISYTIYTGEKELSLWHSHSLLELHACRWENGSWLYQYMHGHGYDGRRMQREWVNKLCAQHILCFLLKATTTPKLLVEWNTLRVKSVQGNAEGVSQQIMCITHLSFLLKATTTPKLLVEWNTLTPSLVIVVGIHAAGEPLVARSLTLDNAPNDTWYEQRHPLRKWHLIRAPANQGFNLTRNTSCILVWWQECIPDSMQLSACY